MLVSDDNGGVIFSVSPVSTGWWIIWHGQMTMTVTDSDGLQTNEGHCRRSEYGHGDAMYSTVVACVREAAH